MKVIFMHHSLIAPASRLLRGSGVPSCRPRAPVEALHCKRVLLPARVAICPSASHPGRRDTEGGYPYPALGTDFGSVSRVTTPSRTHTPSPLLPTTPSHLL
jgi:hypothetical protein